MNLFKRDKALTEFLKDLKSNISSKIHIELVYITNKESNSKEWIVKAFTTGDNYEKNYFRIKHKINKNTSFYDVMQSLLDSGFEIDINLNNTPKKNQESEYFYIWRGEWWQRVGELVYETWSGAKYFTHFPLTEEELEDFNCIHGHEI